MRNNRLLPAILVVLAAVAGMAYTLLAGNEPLLGLDLQGGVSVVLEPTGTADGQDGAGRSDEVTDEALDLTVELLRSRIDEIGVAEPEISRQGNNIVVGLPGLIEDQEEALNRLGQTAELRFRPVLTSSLPIIGFEQQLEESTEGEDAEGEDIEGSTETTETTEAESTETSEDAETSEDTETSEETETSETTDTSEPTDTSETSETTVADDEQSLGRVVTGVSGGQAGAAGAGSIRSVFASTNTDDTTAPDTEEPTDNVDTEAEAEGTDAVVDGTDAEADAEVGEVPELTDEQLAELTQQLEGSAAGANPINDCFTQFSQLLSEGLETTPEADDLIDSTVILAGEGGQRYCLGPAVLADELLTDPEMTPRLTGEMVETAAVSLDTTQGWTVNLTLNGGVNGIDKFNAIALACYTSNQTVCPGAETGGPGRLAVVLDHEVISAPSINAPNFLRDRIQISGAFDEEGARRLSESLRFGALPLELVAQETRTVSASIGSDVLSSGVIAGLIGLALVAIYLLAYYRLAGLVAIGGLLISGMLLWTIVAWFGSSFGLALTLSGVVGLIVAIGVSADSNIVYFENVKDSYRSGRRIPTAVERAYESAISTIIKADVVSLIAAVLLYLLTVGAVRGFAFYLGLATLLDLVISMLFMRPALAWLARLRAVESNPRLLGLPAEGGPGAEPPSDPQKSSRVPAATGATGGAS